MSEDGTDLRRVVAFTLCTLVTRRRKMIYRGRREGRADVSLGSVRGNFRHGKRSRINANRTKIIYLVTPSAPLILIAISTVITNFTFSSDISRRSVRRFRDRN